MTTIERPLVCDQCGKPLPRARSGRGRPRVHCSKGCARRAEKKRARTRAAIAAAEYALDWHSARVDTEYGGFHRVRADAAEAELAELLGRLGAGDGRSTEPER